MHRILSNGIANNSRRIIQSTFRGFSVNSRLFNQQATPIDPKFNTTANAAAPKITETPIAANQTPVATTQTPLQATDLPPQQPQYVVDADDFESLKNINLEYAESSMKSFWSYFNPINYSESALEILHYSAGVPWWGCIMIGAVVIRLCVFPLHVISTKASSTAAIYAKELQQLRGEVSQCATGSPQQRAAQKKLTDFQKEKNISLLKPFTTMLSTPFLIVYFLTLRRMVTTFDSFQYGGALWFVNLSISDPYLLLPLASCACIVLGVELNSLRNANSMSSDTAFLFKWGVRCSSVLILALSAYQPSAIVLYWVCSGFCNIIQGLVLSNKKVMKYFEIPERTAPTIQEIKNSPLSRVSGYVTDKLGITKEEEKVTFISYQEAQKKRKKNDQ
ncbi:mitochondrial inner membrane protein [Acrasis kona]|uniref:Mitochondrial inner membrane protein n=1 Tax=Acrasis kona TaxID=1008807 RepID=A0AAW2ZKN2_9EUKA